MMLTPKRNLLRILSYTLLVSVLFIGFSGCKRQQPVVEDTPREPSAKQIQMNKAKSALQALLDQNYTNLSQVEDAERELGQIKGMGIGDTTIASLILDVEDKLARERERLAKKEAEAKAKAEKAAFNANIDGMFNDIAGASSTNIANMKIEQALSMFSSNDALVLIAISEENGKKDYDRPTTIGKYLNYLKDQKKNPNSIGNVVLDSQGKIKELELIKNN